MDTQPISIVRPMELSELYIRFWADHKICKYAVPIRATPHFEVAESFRRGSVMTQRYEAYIAYAAPHYRVDGQLVHTTARYLSNLDKWSKRFDLVSNPLEVRVRNGIAFLVDGEHRAAYALAAGYHRIPVRLSKLDESWGWEQDVERAASMEEVPGNYTFSIKEE